MFENAVVNTKPVGAKLARDTDAAIFRKTVSNSSRASLAPTDLAPA
jgi:hypothetical protein